MKKIKAIIFVLCGALAFWFNLPNVNAQAKNSEDKEVQIILNQDEVIEEKEDKTFSEQWNEVMPLILSIVGGFFGSGLGCIIFKRLINTVVTNLLITDNEYKGTSKDVIALTKIIEEQHKAINELNKQVGTITSLQDDINTIKQVQCVIAINDPYLVSSGNAKIISDKLNVELSKKE